MFLRAHAKGRKRLKGFKFGDFIGRFPSDRAAWVAVKVLELIDFVMKLTQE